MTTSLVRFPIVEMYTAVRGKLVHEGACRRRAAREWEQELSMRYPGWEDPEDGPVAKWEREWLRSGYLCEGTKGELRCALPAGPRDVLGAMVNILPAATRMKLRLTQGADGSVKVRVDLAATTWVPVEGASVRASVAARPDSRVVLVLRTTESDAEFCRQDSLGSRTGAVAAPTDWVVYTDGGYDSGTAQVMGSERAGWGWVAVSGGNGEDDGEAVEMARACGPVVLESSADNFVGAVKLSNNTAEAQALVEALQWVLLAEPPADAMVLFRTDSRIVVGWATGRTACHENRELVAVLRSLWSTAAGRWMLRWSHVKGHSGHKWNDDVDTLATRGSEGEAVGFSGGQPLPEPPEHVPLWGSCDRYAWTVDRIVCLRTSDCGDEFIISSYFGSSLRRGAVQFVAAGSCLPLRDPPSRPLVEDVVATCRVADSSTELVCHSRPHQMMVFDAEGRSPEEAESWVRWLVAGGVGEQVVEARVPAVLSGWELRSHCLRVATRITHSDLGNITGGTPPREDGEPQEAGGVWEDGWGFNGNGAAAAQGAQAQHDLHGQPAEAAPRVPLALDVEASIGNSFSLISLSELRPAAAGSSRDVLPWTPERLSIAATVDVAPRHSPRQPDRLVQAADPLRRTPTPSVGAVVGELERMSGLNRRPAIDGALSTAPTDAASTSSDALFAVADTDLAAAQMRVPACQEDGRPPQAAPLGNHREPSLARAFSGWGADGTELFREFWPVTAGTIRPVPQRQVHPHGESASSRPALAQVLRESEARLSLDVGTPGEHAGEHASSVSGAWARRAGSTIAWGWAALRGAAHTAWSAAAGALQDRFAARPTGPVQRPNLPD